MSSFGSTKERIAQNLVVAGDFLYTINPSSNYSSCSVILSFSSCAVCKFCFFSNHRRVCENHLSIVELLVKASNPLIRPNL